ncbi:hypothetical protein HY641_04605 [Candidatus Woesearchaeota archaeon]|nr:hypothetical protein [Candidatus Woesearchaeota archaeon]
MQATILCSRGLGELAAREIEAVVGVKAQILLPQITDRLVSFDASLEGIAKCAYRSQLAQSVLILLGRSSHPQDTQSALEGLVVNADISLLADDKSFCVRVEKVEWDAFPSQELERLTGELMLKRKSLKVNLKDPDFLVKLIVTPSELLLCLDTAKDDLSKRDYKIFSGADPFKATTAAGFALFAGFDHKKVVVDLLCGAGLLGIESALIAQGRSPHFFHKERFLFSRWAIDIDWDEQFDLWDRDIKERPLNLRSLDANNRNVESGKKNAKIAGVIKSISFARIDPQWLDVKFEESSVDLLYALVNLPGRTPKDVDKWYDEFFYQGEFILKSSATAALLTRQPELAKPFAQKRRFKFHKELQIFQGGDSWTALAWKCAK